MSYAVVDAFDSADPADYNRNAGDDTTCQRNDDKEENAHEQRTVRHGHIGNAQQKLHDRYKSDQNDQIIGCYLHHGIGRVAVYQCAPDKNHRRAGSRSLKHCASQILCRQIR